MKVPFGSIVVTEKSKALMKEVLDSNQLSCGRYVSQFEEKVAQIFGVETAVAVSTGTDALIVAMAALLQFGAKRGDEIIVPALTFQATANAVFHAGFTPVFADIERKTLNINPADIEKRITKRTRAILPVHLMGKPAEMDTIMEIARKNHLYVIEDAAEAHGAEYKGKKVGTLGDLGCFSFYVAHIISTVEGGVITTNKPDFAMALKTLRTHGYNPDAEIRFTFEQIGYSSKMNEMEAVIGLGNLELYDSILKKRRENLFYLMKGFEKFRPYMVTIQEEPYEKIGPHAFPIVIQENAKFTRNQFMKYLTEKGIESRTLFDSMPTQCPAFKFLGYKLGEFPDAEYVGKNGLHIGVHQELTKNELDYVFRIVGEFISNCA